MDRRRATEAETGVTAELDLSVSKHISGCGGTSRTKSRKYNNELNKQNETPMQSTIGSPLSPSVSLDPTHASMPARSSISSLLSMSHLRLWENPITASAISAAAAMTHLMDINNSAFNSMFGGKSSEDNRVNSTGNMCLICGRVARDQNELENHMLTHSMEKSYHCAKYGLTQSRINGLLMTSKKRKSKHLSQSSEQPLDVSMPDIRRKRADDCPNAGSIGGHSPNTKLGSESVQSMNNNSNAFPCTSCHKTFATEVDLKAHLMRHLTQHPFVCLACGKGFKYEHSLNFHIKSYHNSGANNNNNNNNNNSINLNNNNNVTNNSENEIKIQNSHKLSDSSQKKTENTENLNLENASEVDNDDETSVEGDHSDEDNDEEYLDKSHYLEMGAPPLNLGARSIQIKSEKLLITMLEGIHPVTEQTYILYKCCLCGFAFPSLEPVIVHLQTSHLNTNKEFTCDKCGANFKWRSELTLHEQLHKAMDHNDRSGAPLSVPAFMQPNLVLMSSDFGHNMSPNHSFETNNNEMKSMSDGVSNSDEKLIPSQYRPHKKSYLQTKQIKIKSEPKQHSFDIKSEGIQNAVPLPHKFPTAVGDIVETSPGQFKCRFCDKTFDRIFSVHRHERVHTGFKPCICKTCGRGFSEKRNLRHHIIRFHSDGSGRELLKRNRKDKNNASDNSRRKLATNLKKTALKILNGNDSDIKKNNDNNEDNRCQQMESEGNEEQIQSADDQNQNNVEQSKKMSNTSTDTSIVCPESTNALIQNKSSSNRRRKGKPSKKIIIPEEEYSPEESSSLSTEDNGEIHVKEEVPDTSADANKDESGANSGSEINPNDFLETKLRCHGAFFSSYNPRLGVVEKPVKRNEACRPLMGPDGKFLYPCTYCNKTFCSLSDLNRHMNFHEDVRPFKCEFCNYQSRTNSQLKVHMMRHAGIKQYLCSICNYNGVTQSDLNRHCKTRSHALRSANICPLCSLGFSTRTLLDEHIIKFHETLESSDSSEKSNKNSNSCEKSSAQESNQLSNSSKSFSVKEILN